MSEEIINSLKHIADDHHCCQVTIRGLVIPELTRLQAEVERLKIANERYLNVMYNRGYLAGHRDTVGSVNDDIAVSELQKEVKHSDE